MSPGLLSRVSRFIDSFFGLTRGFKMMILQQVIGAISGAGFFSVYAKSLGATDIEIGLFSSVGFFIGMLTYLPGGFAGQRWNAKKLYILSLFVSSVSSLLIFSATDWVWLLASVILGSLRSFMDPALGALVKMVTDEASRVTALTTQSTIIGVAHMVNSPIMGYLADNIGIRPLYLISAIGTLVGILFIYKLFPATAMLRGKVEKEQKPESKFGYREAWSRLSKKRNFYLMILQGMIWFLFVMGFYQFISIYFVYQLGWSYTFLGFFSMVGSVLATLTRIPLGKIADKIGKKPILVTDGFIAATQFLLYIFVTDPWQLLLIAASSSALMSAHGSVNSAFFYEIVPIEVYPIIYSINMIAMQFAGFVGALLCAYIWSSTSPQTSFAVMALGWIAVALTYSGLGTKKHISEEK